MDSNSLWFIINCCDFLVLLWAYLVLLWRTYLVLLWSFYFCCDQFEFAVRFMQMLWCFCFAVIDLLLLWQLWATVVRKSNSLKVRCSISFDCRTQSTDWVRLSLIEFDFRTFDLLCRENCRPLPDKSSPPVLFSVMFLESWLDIVRFQLQLRSIGTLNFL